jgi:ankyrin repeat protein
MRTIVSLCSIATLGACAMSPEQLAYRERLEGGYLARDEIVRFKTPEFEQRALVADARVMKQSLAQGKDRELLQAARNGDGAKIKTLLSDGAQVNSVDEWGNTALLLAAQEGSIDTVQQLLRAGAMVNGRGGAMTPLGAAALRGHTLVARQLVRAKADIDAVGANGHTALMNAVSLNRLEVAKVLIEAGANTRVLDRAGDNLLVVCINKNFPDMLAQLLQLGVKPDLRDANGLTPLYWAQHLERPAMANALRKAGANEAKQKTELVVSQPYSLGEFK